MTKDILINFIINLPVSKGYINIIVVIDQLSKIRYLIAYPNILTPYRRLTVSRLRIETLQTP
jgi:hypothetical protein